jgi:hypothetical protein
MLQEQTNYLQQIINNSKGMVDNVKNYENKVKAFLQKSYADFPVAPNILSHTKSWKNMCQGKVNTPMKIADAHKGSGWGMFNYRGVSALNMSTIEVVTLDNLDMKGMPMDATLQKAVGYLRNGSYYGSSNIRVLLFDMNLPKGHKYTYLIDQGCPQFTGWSRGQFKTQSRMFVNVLSQSGTAYFAPAYNEIATIYVGKSELGKGWKYKTAQRMGWGGCNQQYFGGEGRIKVAIALPYASTGYHGPDNFVWAGSVATKSNSRWSHDDVILNK